jgi:hypothetical protein
MRSLTALATLIPLYPTLNRPYHAALSTLALRFLNGSAPEPTEATLLHAASSLYATLHYTGGKVGSSNLWRKSVDETIGCAWIEYATLRSTFRTQGMLTQIIRISGSKDGIEDVFTGSVPKRNVSSNAHHPNFAVPLHLDRLKTCVTVLTDLLRCPCL